MNEDYTAIKYNSFAYQTQFEQSKKQKVYLSTGFGGGKTYSLIQKTFTMMTENYGMPGGILCPTLKMYKKDVVPTFYEIIDDNDLAYEYNRSDLVWYFPDANAEIHIFHSEDEGRSIRGPNLAWGAINEVTLCSFMAFNAFISRIRLKKAKHLQCAMSGTPESFNWCYEYFIENPRDDTELIFGDATLNPHVHTSYFDILRESYDDLMQQQYIEGKFVNLKGNRCAYAFDRFKHTSNNINKLNGYPVLVSCDFNVTPMAAVLWNRLPNIILHEDRTKERNAELQAFDEIKISGADTNDLAKAIREKTSKIDQITIYPDPAGASRSTKIKNLSDIDILRQHGFTDIRYKSKISVRNCLNAMNNMFSKDRILINPKKCPNLIADLEQCVFKEGMFEIDKSNIKRSHWLDGLKNMVEYEFPIHSAKGFREERIR